VVGLALAVGLGAALAGERTADRARRWLRTADHPSAPPVPRSPADREAPRIGAQG
jgi:hypothetical protein